MATPRGVVAGVDRQPLPYGLFSVLSFRPDGADRWQNGTLHESLSCSGAGGIGEYDCDDPSKTVGLPKTLDRNGNQIGEASSFYVYGHWHCAPVGFSVDYAQEQAEKHLLVTEQARVEQALWTGDLGNQPTLASAETETLGGGAVSASAGLGLLEEFIAQTYGSLGVIHVSRGLATALLGKGLLRTSSSRLLTELGTPVAAGAGYPGTGPTGQAVTAPEGWAYASPPLFGYRSDIINPSSRAGDLLDRGRNDLTAVAERQYLLGFDPCGVGAVLINPTI